MAHVCKYTSSGSVRIGALFSESLEAWIRIEQRCCPVQVLLNNSYAWCAFFSKLLVPNDHWTWSVARAHVLLGWSCMLHCDITRSLWPYEKNWRIEYITVCDQLLSIFLTALVLLWHSNYQSFAMHSWYRKSVSPFWPSKPWVNSFEQ